MAVFDGYHPLSELCTGWLEKIRLAKEHKQPWQDIADQCQMFFASATGFLWDDKYKHKFWNTKEGIVNPKFKITIHKAFELVSIFGPMLYWRNPTRSAEPRKPMEMPQDYLADRMGLSPEVFQMAQMAGQNGQPPDPQAQMAQFQVQQFQQQFSQIQQQQFRDASTRSLRAELMKRMLNWTPYELRLHRHAERAITEALVKGRGLLFSEPYRPPGSSTTMIGSFWRTVDKFYVDPDAEDIYDAWWISIEYTLPTWKAERKWNHPKGSLENAGSEESLTAQGEMEHHPDTDARRAMNRTQDLMTVHEIWSRCGVGARLTNVTSPLKDKLDRYCGDYCHLVVAEGVPFPLNMPSKRLFSANNEEVQRAFQWPTPHWRDGKWPCAILDFYSSPRSVWPVAPMAPGLGELMALNVFIAHLANRVWMSSRDFIVSLESVAKDVEKIFRDGQDQAHLRVPDSLRDDFDKVVKFIQQPQTNLDAWKIVEALSEMFERRTGLSEILYGIQGPASRTATDAQLRQQNVSHRPEHMAAKVEEWMTEVASREALASRWWLRGDDVRQVLGEVGARMWEELIVNSPVELTIHDVDYRIEASSARKPNRDRDVANINEALPMLMPVLQVREQMSGNYQPINWLMGKWGESVEMDVSGMQSEPPPPQPDPAQQQAEMQMQMKQAEARIKQAGAEAKIQQGQEGHQQKMGQKQQEHEFKMVSAEQKAELDRAITSRKAQLDLAIAKKQAAMKNSNGAGKR